MLFRSPPQQHDFNFPYQLGSEGSDTPRDAQCFMVRSEAMRRDMMCTDARGTLHSNEKAFLAMHEIVRMR